MKRVFAYSALIGVALVAGTVSARTIAYWPLTYRNGNVDRTCAVNPDNNFGLLSGEYGETDSLPGEWNLPPNFESTLRYYRDPTAYSSIGCIRNGDGLGNGALHTCTSAAVGSQTLGTNTFTVEGWYYVPTAGLPGSWRVLVQGGYGSGGASGWCLSLRVDTKGKYYYNFYIQNAACSGAVLGDTNIHTFNSADEVANAWHHIAVVHDQGVAGDKTKWKIYHDGELFFDRDVTRMTALSGQVHPRLELGGRGNSAAQRPMSSYSCWRVSDVALPREQFLNYDPEGKGGTIVPQPVLPETSTVAYWKLGKNVDGTLNLADSVGFYDLHGGLFAASTPFDDGKQAVTNSHSQFTATHDCAFEGNPPNGDLGSLGNHGSIVARFRERISISPPVNPYDLGWDHTTLIVPDMGREISLTNSFTVEGWLYPLRDHDLPNVGQQVVCGTRTFGSNGVKGWTIKWNASDQKFILYANDDHDPAPDASGAQISDLPLNATGSLADWSGWKHFALVYDSAAGNGTWTLYMDGVKQLAVENTAEPTCGNSSRHFYIGARPGDNQGWLGRFDCWRVTKRALAPTEFLCWSGDDAQPVANTDDDVLAIWPFNVTGTHQLDLRDVKGTYTLREPLSGSAYELGFKDDAPVIANPDATTNFCGGADSTIGSFEFKRADGGGRSFLYSSAYNVMETFSGWNWTFETYVKRTPGAFNSWETLFLTFREDKLWNDYPKIDFRFCYTADGFILEDNARFAGNNVNLGGKDALADGEWHHVALTYAGGDSGDPAAFICYVDGEETGRVEGTRKWTQGRSFCAVFGGRPVVDTTTLHGCLSNIRLSNKALTPEKFLCADKGPKPVKAKETLAYWPLESADGQSLMCTNVVPNRPTAFDFFQVSGVTGSSDRAVDQVPLETFEYGRNNVGSAAFPLLDYTAFLRAACREVGLTDSFTLEGWLKWSGNDPGEEKTVAGTYSTAIENGWRLSFLDGTVPSLRLYARAGNRLRSSNVDVRFPLEGKTAIAQNVWSHVAIVHDADTGRGTWTLYVNGKKLGTVENDWCNGMDASLTDILYLGRYSSYTGCPKGLAGNFDMWRLTKGVLGRKELLDFYVKGMLLLLK